MIKWFSILLLILVFTLSQSWSEEQDDVTVAICLRDLEYAARTDLGYIVRGINEVMLNQLALFPNIVVYPCKSPQGEYFKDTTDILSLDKVQLLRIRRETGFDGLIYGQLDEQEGRLSLTIHLVDFSSGRIYFTGTLQGEFGSELLRQLEAKIAAYADALLHYYSCSLRITSEPTGAEVWIDDEKAGVTPIDKLDVKDGQKKMQIKMQGYVPFETQVELKTGQKAALHVQLYKYSLTATSVPSDANVYLDDRKIGVTPITNLVLEQPEFTVKFVKEGFASRTETVSLRPGEQAYIHAELYDLLIDHLRNKKSRLTIDSHNFGLVQTMNFQNLEDIEIEVFPLTNFRYYAKLGRWQTGVNLGWSVLRASQHFDTFMGSKEGYEPFTINVSKNTAFSQYNIIQQLNRIECYVGALMGFSVATASQQYAPADLDALKKVNPVVGGEIGMNFYFSRSLKFSTIVGMYYAGQLEYAVKEASYWGQAVYERQTLKLYPFYAGLSLTYSLWPALMAGGR
jgi:TolB-like protein